MKKTLKKFNKNLFPKKYGSHRVVIFPFNNTHKEKLFFLIEYKNGYLAASELFQIFTQ